MKEPEQTVCGYGNDTFHTGRQTRGNITDNGNHKGHPRICATFAPSSGIRGRRPAGRMVEEQEPDFLLAELLHVLELYTPEGFILGPITGRTHAFGYTNPEYEKNLIYRIEIELDWGYVYGKKNEYRKKRKLYEEIAEIFTTDGYTAEMEKRGKGCRITRGIQGFIHITNG